MFREKLKALTVRAGILGSLFTFLANNKMWWLIPMIVVLVIFFGIILLGSATPLGPFIYTLL